ncbi:MAG: flavodoxin family protein [Bacteroidales bacterium]|nr:flavodoxin family protein [Bacteroidales bacterium]
MKTLIVYGSAFGNTEQIAFAIRDVLSGSGTVKTVKPEDFTPEDLTGIDLLVVGSPTQKFSPLKGISGFLSAIRPGSLKNVKTAAFDTRIDIKKVNNRMLNFMVFLFGYAAQPIAARLKSKGGIPAAPPAGFFVDDTKGPVSAGEIEKAREWARGMLA